MDLTDETADLGNPLSFIREIARLTKDGEEVDGEPFVLENDDAVDTLAGLISQARGLLVSPADGSDELDLQLAQGWALLHALSDALAELTLASIARTVAEAAPGAATLRLQIRYPDEVEMPDGWGLDDPALLDAAGQPIEPELDLEELADRLEHDLDCLASLEEVHPAAEIDLGDPPAVTVTDNPVGH